MRFAMEESVQKPTMHDEPICICGYPKIGLPQIDDPCPECGSIVLAKYKSSFSYYGWNVALLSLGAAVLHFLILLVLVSVGGNFPEELVFMPWFSISFPLGCLSLFFTVMSMSMREQKRRSLRNVILAIASAVVFPIAGFVILLAMSF